MVALEVAMALRAAANAEVENQVRRARGRGHSWAEIAPLLGVDDDVAAFETIVKPRSFEDTPLRWTCESCQQGISDHGPYNGHPDDTERGHGEACARHYREVAAYESQF
jgi:hypothetical protein